MLEREKKGIYPNWDCGLDEWPDSQSGYYIYNLEQCGKNAYEGLLVIKTNYLTEEDETICLAVQKLKTRKENGRWVVVALDNFNIVETTELRLDWGCLELPGTVYSGTHSDFGIDAKVQTVYTIEGTVQNDNSNFFFGNDSSYFDTTPKPNAEFTWAAKTYSEIITHLGTAEDRDKIYRLGLSISPVYSGRKHPENLTVPTGDDSVGSSSNGECWISKRTEPGWDPIIKCGGGGGTFDPNRDAVLPEYFAADLYVNNELVAQLDLQLQEGVAE